MMIELVLISSFVTLILFIINEFRAYYYIKKPEIYSKDNELRKQLLLHCKKIKDAYIPTFWAVNGHLQTWLKSFIRMKEVNEDFCIFREYLEMSDEGVISFDWISKTEAGVTKSIISPRRKNIKKRSINKDKPILLIIPSALNTSVMDYASLCTKAISVGFIPLFFNRRGYSGTPLLTPKVTTYCDRSDLMEAIQYLNETYPFSDLYAIAFSMETGNLINYLGHEREASQIAGAVCVSSTFGCENHLDDHSLKEPYNTILTEKIKSIFQRVGMYETQTVNECKSMVQLQSEIHARSNAYLTMKDYLQYNSPLKHLNHIQVPVMFIQSKDDPVVPELTVPYEFFSISNSCVLVSTEYGGHCGFFEDASPCSWSDDVAIDFLKLISKNRKLFNNNDIFDDGFSRRNRSMTIF